MKPSDQHHEIAQLENEIQALAKEQAQCAVQVKELMAAEAASGENHAAETHRLKQRKMMLGTQMQHLRARIGALKLGLI